jgi:hypothetical protein
VCKRDFDAISLIRARLSTACSMATWADIKSWRCLTRLVLNQVIATLANSQPNVTHGTNKVTRGYRVTITSQRCLCSSSAAWLPVEGKTGHFWELAMSLAYLPLILIRILVPELAALGRVEMWRGGNRFGLSVVASFVWRCPSSYFSTAVSLVDKRSVISLPPTLTTK